MASEDYFIYGDDGGKFCKRFVDDKGEVQLQTKNGTIALTTFITMASNPLLAKKQRGKNYKPARQ